MRTGPLAGCSGGSCRAPGRTLLRATRYWDALASPTGFCSLKVMARNAFGHDAPLGVMPDWTRR